MAVIAPASASTVHTAFSWPFAMIATASRPLISHATSSGSGFANSFFDSPATKHFLGSSAAALAPRWNRDRRQLDLNRVPRETGPRVSGFVQ